MKFDSRLISERLAGLPEESKLNFRFEYDRYAKNQGAAYITWLVFGLHYVYLGKWYYTVAMWFLMFLGVGWLWWLVDALRIPGMVRRYNEELAYDIIDDL